MARTLRNVTANVSTCNISQQRRSNKARVRSCARECGCGTCVGAGAILLGRCLHEVDLLESAFLSAYAI